MCDVEIAREALKDVLIALQGSLLKQLVPAAHSDGTLDFSVLVDVSDIGRIKSVGALWELHMRMASNLFQAHRLLRVDYELRDMSRQLLLSRTSFQS